MAVRASAMAIRPFAWRRGIAPNLSDRGLQALKKALETDDPTLIQGTTTQPPPLQAVQNWPVEAACAVCYGEAR